MMPEEILLRNPLKDDLPVFYTHQLDKGSAAMAEFPSRDKEAFMAHWTKIMADEDVFIQTILFRGMVAGNIVSFLLGDERMLGYWIGREYWGRGLASESVRQFLGLEKRRPLFAHVVKHNLASLRVLEKSGFEILKENLVELQTGRLVEEFILILKARPVT